MSAKEDLEELLEIVNEELTWQCGDCYNIYDATITSCPNEVLHRVKLIKKRNEKRDQKNDV